MRATILVVSLAAASSASAFSVHNFPRQYEGCETPCDPMRDWATGCRTDVVGCQNQCTPELLKHTDNCFACIKEKNPDSTAKIQGYVNMAYQMCGAEAPSADAAASSAAAETSAATSAGSAGAAETSASASQEASASDAKPTASGSAAATGSAAASGTAAPAASSSTVAAPPATSSTSGAGKFGISLGAVALAVSALLL